MTRSHERIEGLRMFFFSRDKEESQEREHPVNSGGID
jgi:hypothetical protein